MHFNRLNRAFTQNLHFFGGHPVVALKMLRKTVEAYIIKWIISGEPPVGLKSQQDSKWGHSWTIHYFTYLSPPCISYILETQRYLGIVPEPFALSSLSWGLEMSRQQSCMLVAHAIIVSALVQKIWFYFFQTLFGPKARTWDLLGQGTWAYYSIKIIKSDRFLSSRIIFLALNLKMFWINKSASRKARVTRHVYIYC